MRNKRDGYQTQVWLLVAQYPNTEKQVVSRRKDSFFEEVGSPGEEVDCVPKTSLPLLIRALKGSFWGAQMGGGGSVQHVWSCVV